MDERKTITPQAIVSVLRHIRNTALENSFWDILPEGTNLREYWGDAAHNAPDWVTDCDTLYVWVDKVEVADYTNIAMPFCSFMADAAGEGEEYVLLWKM